MKFEIAKIVRPIALAEYAEEYGETRIWVWVNPPMRMLDEHDRVVREVREAVRGAFEEPTPGPSLKGREDATPAISLNSTLESAGKVLVRIFAELWSQGGEGTRWSEEEVKELVAETMDSDPRLWLWLRNRTIEAIREHRENEKKS